MIDGYEKLHRGHWYQYKELGNPVSYNVDYVATYNKYPTEEMSRLRFDLVDNIVDFKSVLDVGFGRGDFLKRCVEMGKTSFGHDISGYPIPEGATKSDTTQPADLYTFFDCLEHFTERDLSIFLRNLPCKYLLVTLPLLHEDLGGEHFRTWKHRKPGEHIHHFTEQGLRILMEYSDYDIVYSGHPEDAIRGKLAGNLDNTLTIIGKK
jgi:hypothetical protein